MPKKIAVIDGNSLMHRAFHAVPPTMSAPDGTPTNAAFGFMSMLIKFLEVAAPDAVVCAFDAGRPKFRMEAIEQYKAQRPPMDPDLKAQFPVVEGLLEALDIPVVKVKGWEGDDILGTVSARDEALGYETLLVTGDKDIYQLATDLTKIMTTKKGISEVVIYGPEQVVERYGVTPRQVPDFLGLKGDPSDNIPGVPGIGEKTAAKLLSAYDTLEGLYDNLDKLKGKQLENVRDNKDAAFLSRKVATIVRDVEFDLDLESITFPSFDPTVVSDAFHNVRFNAHLNKILQFDPSAGPAPVQNAVELSWEPILRDDEAHEALEKDREAGERIALSWFEDAQASLFDVGVTVTAHTSSGSAVFTGENALRVVADTVSAHSFAAGDTKALFHLVHPADTSQEALVDAATLLSADGFDLSLAAYALNSSTSDYSPAALFDTYCSSTLPTDDDAVVASAMEAAAIAALVEPLERSLEEDGSTQAYSRIDAPLAAVLAIMERIGAAIDTDTLARLGEYSGGQIAQLTEKIYAEAGEEFNIDSPKQLSHILFEVMGLPAGKKTSRGYSTNVTVLKKLAEDNEIARLVMNYRELAKIKSTYIDALPTMRGEDGLIHTSFNETVTTTGRLSSSNPNLQNIPIRTEFGRHIRECFVPIGKDEVFVSADYSQIELRLLAHLSKDKGLIDAFCSGADFHAATASRVFGVPVEEVTPQMRSRAKAVNFGIVYGQQAFGLAQSLDVSLPEAKEMIDRYFEAYPDVRSYLDETVERARIDGFATTMFGRKRHIPELRAQNKMQQGFGERTAMNHPMQGSAADIIKLAMCEVAHYLVDGGYRTRLMLQVHDELDMSVPVEEVQDVMESLREIMQGVVSLEVPLLVDVSQGSNWAEAH